MKTILVNVLLIVLSAFFLLIALLEIYGGWSLNYALSINGSTQWSSEIKLFGAVRAAIGLVLLVCTIGQWIRPRRFSRAAAGCLMLLGLLYFADGLVGWYAHGLMVARHQLGLGAFLGTLAVASWWAWHQHRGGVKEAG